MTPRPASVPVVAVTRSIDDNRSLTAEFEGRGYRVVVVPLVELAPPADGGRALADAVADLIRYRWVVLTSANGVRSVADRLAGRAWPPGVDVAVVGPGTAAVAREVGVPVTLCPERATAADLVAAFPAAGSDGDGVRVLAPLAQLAGSTVEDGLRAKGWSVDRVEAYRTVDPTETPNDVAGDVDGDVAVEIEVDVDASGRTAGIDEVDIVTFFSPSAVDRWVARFGHRAAEPVAVCIGPSTSARARERGFASIRTAEPHSEAGVIETVSDLVADQA